MARPRDCSSCPLTALAVTAVGDNWPRLTTARPRRENPRPGEGASHTAAAAGPPRTRRGGRSSWNTHPHLLLPLTWTSQPQLCLTKISCQGTARGLEPKCWAPTDVRTTLSGAGGAAAMRWGRLSSARRSILRRMRGWHVAFLWRTYPTYVSSILRRMRCAYFHCLLWRRRAYCGDREGCRSQDPPKSIFYYTSGLFLLLRR